MFYTQLFTSKRGPLAKIWLAAHWEKKITKTHVFECNLEATVRDIISPLIKIGLRTSGHLLLGVVRIYSRKAKYLLADCGDAVVKIKMAFRPGQTDLPSDNLEASFKAITLQEDFTDFESQLPDISAIDTAEHFTLNQCRTEDITLKEDFGNSFLVVESDFGDEVGLHPDGLFDTSFHSIGTNTDGFGDEAAGFDILDLMMSSTDNAMPVDFSSASLNNEFPATPPPTAVRKHEETGSCVGSVEELQTLNETTLLENEKDGFALEPVSITPMSERKSGKRKRLLLVDHEKELSNEEIRRQITDWSELVAPPDLAPPTYRLMEWKETGGVCRLFSRHCVSVIHPWLQQLYPRDLYSKMWWESQHSREEMRGQPDSGTYSSNTDALISFTEPVSSPVATKANEESVLTGEDPSLKPEVLGSDFSQHSDEYHLPSTDINSASPMLAFDTLGSRQAFEEKLMNSRARRLLTILKKRKGSTPFSLRKLCEGCHRTKAATTFFCLLVLKKRRAVTLRQDAPYTDIMVTLSPSRNEV